MRLLPVLVCCCAGFITIPVAEAKGPPAGRGFGSKITGGRGLGSGFAQDLGSRLVNGASNAGRVVVDKVGQGVGNVSGSLTASDQAVTVQRDNEIRQLEQRQDTAEKLREISERNGNQNLKDVADRMDQRAQDQFEKRNQTIDQLPIKSNKAASADGAGSAIETGDLEEDVSLDRNKLVLNQERHILNEERKLEHQLQIAQHLRDLAAKNGNQNLIETAERMELMAAEHYADQLAKFSQDLTPPTPVETAPLPPIVD